MKKDKKYIGPKFEMINLYPHPPNKTHLEVIPLKIGEKDVFLVKRKLTIKQKGRLVIFEPKHL